MAVLQTFICPNLLCFDLDRILEMGFVQEAVDQALEKAKPEIWNSDQGSHFTSAWYIDRLSPNQHGFKRPSIGQHLYRTIMQDNKKEWSALTSDETEEFIYLINKWL